MLAQPANPSDPPTILALYSKLTGDVDPAKIIQYAPNELLGLPGYQGSGNRQASTLSGFQAWQLNARTRGTTFPGPGRHRGGDQPRPPAPAPDRVRGRVLPSPGFGPTRSRSWMRPWALRATLSPEHDNWPLLLNPRLMEVVPRRR